MYTTWAGISSAAVASLDSVTTWPSRVVSEAVINISINICCCCDKSYIYLCMVEHKTVLL